MNRLKPDWYSEKNTPTPKADIAEYVRNETDVAVPVMFETLDEGLRHVKNGGSIIIRSESPDQYEGPSGIFQSYVITPDSLAQDIEYWMPYADIAELSDKEIAFAATRGGFYNTGSARYVPSIGIMATAMDAGEATTYHRLLTDQRWSGVPSAYSRLKHVQVEAYMANNTFSVHEYIDGLNVTVAADSAKPDRWQVYGSRRTHGASWFRMNNGAIDNRGGKQDLISDDAAQQIINAYENIRQLPHFNPEHCPIMEMQLSDAGELYFLQYHRARDFAEAQNELDPNDFPVKDGWIEADDVRGVLSKQNLDLTLYYPTDFDHQRKLRTYLKTEKASANLSNHYVAEEVVGRNRLLRVASHGATVLHADCADGHMSRSGWFKAQSGLVLPRDALKQVAGAELFEAIAYEVGSSRTTMAALAIEAAADGDRGYVRIDRERGVYGLVSVELER